MQIMHELYQPNVYLSVRLPFESTIVSSCQYNSNVLTIRGCNFSCCRCFERRVSYDGYGYECILNMLACGT